MSAVAASGNNVAHATLGLDIVANQKGTMGNLITVYAVVDPAGATGASTLVESGNTAYVKLKNAGAGSTATLAEMLAAFNTGRLVTAALHTAATGANTGAAFTGTTLVGGANGTYGYDDLSGAVADNWVLETRTNASYGNVDTMTKYDRRKGGKVRVSAVSITGATNVVQAAFNEENRRALMGYPRSLMGASGAQAYEYSVQV